MKIPFSAKIFILTFIVSVTFFYSHYEKKKYSKLEYSSDESLVLKKMPELRALDVYDLAKSDKTIWDNLVKTNNNLIIVHFWGTWCAPCEAELPDFLEFAKKYSDKKVKFIIIAVNDKLREVKKFLKRFNKEELSNVTFAFDEKGKMLPLFGTYKVPETFIFGENLLLRRKLLGPQDWNNEGFNSILNSLLTQ